MMFTSYVYDVHITISKAIRTGIWPALVRYNESLAFVNAQTCHLLQSHVVLHPAQFGLLHCVLARFELDLTHRALSGKAASTVPGTCQSNT